MFENYVALQNSNSDYREHQNTPVVLFIFIGFDNQILAMPLTCFLFFKYFSVCRQLEYLKIV